MISPLLVNGMDGLGDNLHQRAIVRSLMDRHDIWLETPWPCVYHDLAGPRLHLVRRQSALRTQAKNAVRERGQFSRVSPPPRAVRLRIWYKPENVRSSGSVLGAMCRACDVNADGADFRLPVPDDWMQKAESLLARFKVTKPILIYRPLVERSEWSGCPARNPDHEAYASLFASIRDRFFVISIADLVPGREWIVGAPVVADAEFHGGELDFETIAALTRMASLVYCSPGFAVILAQAVETPVVAVFGGYENSSSFSGRSRFAPYLGIDPITPCDCFSHTHGCDKRIDLPQALRRIEDFVNVAAPDR